MAADLQGSGVALLGRTLVRVLTDSGAEYCGNRKCHEYLLYLAVEKTDHSHTKAKSPPTNGICERCSRISMFGL